MKSKIEPYSRPEERFCAALHTLESYTQQKPLPKFFFPKILSLAKQLINEKTFPRVKESTIQQALDEIERFLPFIHHRDHIEGKNLAARAHEIILSCLKNSHFSAHPAIVQRLRRLADSEIPPFKKENSHTRQRIEFSVPERVKDIFRMKAISMVDEYGAFSFYQEKVRSIHKAPIELLADPKEKNVLLLEQRLSPLPGMTIILRGSFKNGLPLPGSFELVAESQQTGFPDSLQHHGFAFPFCILPSFPMRPERMPSLSKILQERELLKKELVARGTVFEGAQLLIEQNKQAVLLHKTHYLSLLKNLLLAICFSAPRFLAPEAIRETLNAFFMWLTEQPCPLTAFASVNREVNRHYVQEVAESWSQFRLEKPQSNSPKEARSAAQDFFAGKILNIVGIQNLEIPVAAYSDLVGKILGNGCVNLLLQDASEVEQWAPPQLSLFEKKMLAIALEQQITFIKELGLFEKSKTPLNAEQKRKRFSELKQRIEWEIAVYQSPKIQNPLVYEIERYYASRYVAAFH